MKSESQNLQDNSTLDTPSATTREIPPPNRSGQAGAVRGLKPFIVFAAIVVICFARPLLNLIVFAAKSELYSYILLIPFVSAYLIKIKRAQLDPDAPREAQWALVPLIAGAALFGGYRFAVSRGWTPARTDYLAVMTLSFLCFLLSGGFFFLGAKYLRAVAFPVAFAFFCVPFPERMQSWIETVLQHGSADVAAMMFGLSGMPVNQDDTTLHLPGFKLEVAPECSGIHSSLILLITSLVAGYLFFRSSWRRLALALAVIPLAYLRNGFRIFTIGQLCVRISPDMINSPIHRRGGVIFFALSMVPFMLFLVWLRKREMRKRPERSF